MSSATFRNLLEAGDAPGLMAFWAEKMPSMPQPKGLEQATAAMHMARTAADSVSLRFRAYSHRWLLERDLPSQLPDKLKPSAERLYPVVVDGVGISVNTMNKWMEPAMVPIRQAMETAVEEAYADNRRDPAFVKVRMNEARDREFKALFGRLTTPL